jgi:hypothetical protein
VIVGLSAECSGPISLAMPKSSSLEILSFVIRMFPGFRVAVNHQMLVGILHGFTHQAKSFHQV